MISTHYELVMDVSYVHEQGGRRIGDERFDEVRDAITARVGEFEREGIGKPEN